MWASSSTTPTGSQGVSRSRSQVVHGAGDAGAACRLLCIAAEVLDKPQGGNEPQHTRAQLRSEPKPLAQGPPAEPTRLLSPPAEPAAHPAASAHTHTHLYTEEDGKRSLAGRLLSWLWDGGGARDAPPAPPSSEGGHTAKPEQLAGPAGKQPAVSVGPAWAPAEGQGRTLAGDGAAAAPAAAASALMAALVPLIQAHAGQLPGELLLPAWRAVARMAAFLDDGSSEAGGGGVGAGAAGGGGWHRAAGGGQRWVAAMGAAFAGGELRWAGFR